MRALVIIETESATDFDAAVRAAQRSADNVRVVVLDENWDLPEHANL